MKTEESKFDTFLSGNPDLRDAARDFAEDTLGKEASEKAIINCMVVFVMGAVWQADQVVKKLEKAGLRE